MAETDGLQLPVGVTEKQFMQQIARMENRLAKMEGENLNKFRRSNKGAEKSFAELDKAAASSLRNIGASATAASKTFLFAFAGGAITGALAGLTMSLDATVKGIAAVGDEAKRSGLSMRVFQEWKFVAEQNRIGIDALVDGFKELSLRADEFIVTGAGSAAEAFARIGYNAEDLKAKLKDPSALMLEIIGRLQGLDEAAQIRIADELFGGTGGEQFVQLLAQGDAAIAKTIERGHELGAVMHDEMILKAQELDRRWQEITTTTSSWFKGMAVGIADTIAKLFEAQAALDELLGSEDRARAILGNEVYESLQKNKDAIDENAEGIAQLDAAYATLSQQARSLAIEMFAAAQTANILGNDELWQVLSQAGNDLNTLADQFYKSEITAQEFAEKLLDVQSGAEKAFDELDRSDQVQFSGAISQMDALGAKIGEVIGLAQGLLKWVSAAAGASAPSNQGFAPDLTRFAPLTDESGKMDASPSPASRPGNWAADMDGDGAPDALQDTKTRRGGGGGGKGKENSRIESLISELQTEEEVLTEWYDKSLEMLNSATEAQLEALGGKHEAIERLTQEHADRLAAIEEAKNRFSLQSALGAGADILGALGSTNKKALKMSQTFAAAEAFVSTYKGAAKELEKGTFGFATAAAVIAKGIGFVAAIKGINADGGGGGGRAGGGSTSSSTPAPLPTQRIDIAWGGPMESRGGMQALIDIMNDAAAKGLRVDARLVAPK